MNRPLRVAFLTNIISPYRRPVFQRLAATAGWKFRVFVNAETEFDRSWSVDTSGLDVVRSTSLTVRRRVRSTEPVPFEQRISLHFPTGLWGDLRRFRPDVVISHELGPRSLLAALYARMHRVPLVLWAYQSRISGTQGGPVRNVLRRWLLRQARYVVGMGTQARGVLRDWGVPNASIIDAPNAADTDGLSAALEDAGREFRAARIRREVGGGKKIALVVGRLVPLKGVSSMLQAWKRIDPAIRRDWKLVFIGEGPLEPLVREAGPLGVRLVPQVDPERMADWYAACDLHVFPTWGDVWGLVVNEAMACGRPTLCSVHAGCSSDLLRHGKNGMLFDPTDAQSAPRALEDAFRRSDLNDLGLQAADDVRPFTPDRLADGFREAVGRTIYQPGNGSRSRTLPFVRSFMRMDCR